MVLKGSLQRMHMVTRLSRTHCGARRPSSSDWGCETASLGLACRGLGGPSPPALTPSPPQPFYPSPASHQLRFSRETGALQSCCTEGVHEEGRGVTFNAGVPISSLCTAVLKVSLLFSFLSMASWQA